MRRPGFRIIALWLGMAIQAHAANTGGELVFIGTHGSLGPPGQATDPVVDAQQGVYAIRLDPTSGHLSSLGITAQLQRATWLVTHPTLPVLYTVADSGGGIAAESDLYSFSINRASGKLQELNEVGAGAVDATHLDLDGPSKTLFSASFGSGSVTAFPLLPDGSLGPAVSAQKDFGTGPNKRQKHPVAHGVTVDPSHHYVLVADFGADRIFIYHFDAQTRALTPAETPFETVPAGSGPRHLLFNPNGKIAYLITELTGEIRSYTWNAKHGRLRFVQALSPFSADYSSEKSAGEIVVSRDGRFLYLSLRGDENSIVVYALDQRAGTLQEVQRISSHGVTPWSFAIDPTGRWMLVTNDNSNSVNVLKVDSRSGKLETTEESVSIPRPVTVVFYPH